MDIERAVLSSAREENLIHARIEYGGSWVWPRCSLLEGPAVKSARGIIPRRDPLRAEGFTRSLWAGHESLWADRRAIEKFIADDGSVLWVFREDPTPDDGAAGPRRTPFYVRCVGGEQPGVVHDVAHISGTPGTISEPAAITRRDL